MGYSMATEDFTAGSEDAPREGRMGYSNTVAGQTIERERCAPRGAHGLQCREKSYQEDSYKDAPREGRMGYSLLTDSGC